MVMIRLVLAGSAGVFGIRQRVANFKAYQQKMAQEREDYYLQMKAKMLASLAKRD
jgi:hypothetical protein